MQKKNQTLWTMVIGIVIIALLCVIIFKFWVTFVTAGIAFAFGYFFGYRGGKAKAKA